MQPEQPFAPNTQPVVETAAQAVPNETQPVELPEQQPLQWQAPEYLQDRRSPWWFVGFWLIVILFMAIAILLIKSWSFAILIPAMAAALMIYSHRPPRQVVYVLSAKGIYINDKLHPMSEFKSFGVMRDESLPSAVLIPVRRFRPALTMHFPPEAGEAIVDMLGSRIPMQNIRLDFFDKLTRQLHL